MKNENPKISIIVPMYNCAEYAPQCIDSIINQTYPNWELWLCNGDSKDGTEAVCESYAEKDDRIHNLYHLDSIVKARNAGYEHSTGDWIMYVDGDDWIDTDTCEKTVHALNKYDGVDIIFWKDVQELGDKTIHGKWEWPCSDSEHLYEGDECKEVARHTMVYHSGIATAYAKLIRREYAQKYNIQHDARLSLGMEGIEFSLRSFYYAQKALYLNAYFNHYRYNPMSLTKSVNYKHPRGVTECIEVFKEDINKFENKKIFEETLKQRVAVAVIAVAMNPFFHPDNGRTMFEDVKDFKAFLASEPFYKEAIYKSSTEGLGKLRSIALWIIRLKLYGLLLPIASLKQYYIKKGKFNY